MSQCAHQSIWYSGSPYATVAGYRQPSQQQRTAATKPTASRDRGTKPRTLRIDAKKFPAPLVLPDDDLALDPDYPAQSFQEWLGEEDRNEITSTKKTIYVVPPPDIDESCAFMQAWTKPQKGDDHQNPLPAPQIQDVADYLAAFYHGLPVKLLPISDFRFLSWDEGKKASRTAPRYVGLAIGDEVVRVGTRACPDKLYLRQLNLDDLLDVAISLLPPDAYALCFLVDHDLFENKDDEFVCGRAYGGSRVAVVSSARYCPSLDTIQRVERQHAWPASHCNTYIQSCCSSQSVPKKPRTSKQEHLLTEGLPLDAAVTAYSKFSNVNPSPRLLSALWLARMCRTASHELGHCFGIDHCVYYACIMQGSASLSEDTRQPPDLCPVDLSKLLYATGESAIKRYHELLEFCRRPAYMDMPFFSAFAAWLDSILGDISA